MSSLLNELDSMALPTRGTEILRVDTSTLKFVTLLFCKILKIITKKTFFNLFKVKMHQCDLNKK